MTVFQPNHSLKCLDLAFAPASFPLTKNHGSEPVKGLPMIYQSLTYSGSSRLLPGITRAESVLPANPSYRRKSWGHPFGEIKGLEDVDQDLPIHIACPAIFSASSDTMPDVQLKRSSPNAAASANVPCDALGTACLHPFLKLFRCLRCAIPFSHCAQAELIFVPMVFPTIPVLNTYFHEHSSVITLILRSDYWPVSSIGYTCNAVKSHAVSRINETPDSVEDPKAP